MRKSNAIGKGSLNANQLSKTFPPTYVTETINNVNDRDPKLSYITKTVNNINDQDSRLSNGNSGRYFKFYCAKTVNNVYNQNSKLLHSTETINKSIKVLQILQRFNLSM